MARPTKKQLATAAAIVAGTVAASAAAIAFAKEVVATSWDRQAREKEAARQWAVDREHRR